jgi:protein O-mannosyl-transferase
MAKKRSHRKPDPPAAVAPPPRRTWWTPAALTLAGILLVFWTYGPSLHGPFLFDDNFALPAAGTPLNAWIHGVRPLLMASYWLNAHFSGTDTYSYHLAGVLFHCVAGALIFFIVRRLMEWSGLDASRRSGLALFASGVFLLHPLQTESVAYLAGRSETLSVMLFLAAYAVFVCRPKPAVSWLTAVSVLALFGAALLSKEHTIILLALLLLTDFWWNPGFSLAGIGRNWKLYTPMLVIAAGGVVTFLPQILHAASAGFGLKDLTWYQYFFTQCRALFIYPFLFAFPVYQSADWGFPMSKTILDHGAIAGLVALVALVVLAWHFRRRYRLASFGFFAYLLLMAPTSSIVPIRDAVAERRLYISMLGLLLIAVDFLGRWKLERRQLAAACAAIILIYTAVAHARAAVWSSELSLWEDTVQKSPANYRAHFQLAQAYFNAGQCPDSVAEFQKAAQLQTPGFDLLLDWGLAYDCLHQTGSALDKLRQSAALEPTALVYTQIAKVYADNRQWDEAANVLETARKMDPNFAATYWYRGNIHFVKNELPEAIQDFRQALALDPTLIEARQSLGKAEQRLLAKH